MSKLINKWLSLCLVCLTTICILSMSVFAADALVKCNKILDAQKVAKWVSSQNTDDNTVAVLDKTYKIFQVTVDTSDNGTASSFSISYVGDSNSNYMALTHDEQEKSKEEMLSTVSGWGLSQEAIDDITTKFRNQPELEFTDSALLKLMFADTKADLAAAMRLFSPFQGTVGLILGIGVVFIILLLIVSTVFDLVYLGIPIARNNMDSKAEKKNSDRPFGVSRDACRIIEEYDKEGGGQGNIYFIYLKKRISTYIILAICILYLISGQLAGLIGWLMDLVSGFGA